MVAWLHPSVQITILLIIIVSAGLAVLFMPFLTRGTEGIGKFGVAKSPASYVIAATLGGIVVGGALAYLAALYPAPSPLDLSKLPRWMIFVYFVLAAPVQEELIFRGLLQTTIGTNRICAGRVLGRPSPGCFRIRAFRGHSFGLRHRCRGQRLSAGLRWPHVRKWGEAALAHRLITVDLRHMKGRYVDFAQWQMVLLIVEPCVP